MHVHKTEFTSANESHTRSNSVCEDLEMTHQLTPSIALLSESGASLRSASMALNPSIVLLSESGASLRSASMALNPSIVLLSESGAFLGPASMAFHPSFTRPASTAATALMASCTPASKARRSASMAFETSFMANATWTEYLCLLHPLSDIAPIDNCGVHLRNITYGGPVYSPTEPISSVGVLFAHWTCLLWLTLLLAGLTIAFYRFFCYRISDQGSSQGKTLFVTEDHRMGGGATYRFNGANLMRFVSNANNNPDVADSEWTYEFQCKPSDTASVLARHHDCLSAKVDVVFLVDHLTAPDMIQLSKVHDFWLKTKTPTTACRDVLRSHACDSCIEILTIFKRVPKPVLKKPNLVVLIQHTPNL
ncbi:hypothetical protein B0H16DRAFT_1482034 [Mycena metata]|uniref:Uncharacterized protein n=1 Tax=Mycena metata TaxID=1033252 RepID=A0AAD7M8U9_9AGAR|nr:hypothetical protein B0H16DRAFT_1482034 [Mycena metata]